MIHAGVWRVERRQRPAGHERGIVNDDAGRKRPAGRADAGEAQLNFGWTTRLGRVAASMLNSTFVLDSEIWPSKV